MYSGNKDINNTFIYEVVTTLFICSKSKMETGEQCVESVQGCNKDARATSMTLNRFEQI